MRIAIIGYSGGGKSTLARRLGAMLGIPVLHMDQVHWMPGWQEREDAEAIAMLQRFMDQDDWVIEGNYAGLLLDRRMREADEIVMLDLPRLTCFRRALSRARRYRGVVRPDMAPGCRERMDAEFAFWLLVQGRAPKRRRRFDAICRRYRDKVRTLRSQSDIDRYVRGVEASVGCRC